MSDKHDKKGKKDKKGDKMKKVLLVTGVGGQTGGASLRAVLQHAKSAKWEIRAGTRDPEATKAKLALPAADTTRVTFVKYSFEYNAAEQDAATKAALGGVTTAILIMPNDNNRDKHLVKQAEFAFANGVSHVVSITGISMDMPGSKFYAVGAAAWVAFHEANKARITDIRPNFFMDNFWGQKDSIVNTDTFYLALPKGGYSHVAVNDIGALAAGVALKAKSGGNVYRISGPKNETIEELAYGASKGLGRPIKGVAVPSEGAIQGLVGTGVPQYSAEGIVEMFDWITQRRLEKFQSEWHAAGPKDFCAFTGRPQLTTEDWFKKNAAGFTKH
jgi:uncharacterized protein YbjT (DUF2867 family)